MTMPLNHDVIVPKVTPHCVARALFDNLAESPDELAFRRGDILTVLEQNTGGSEGWWLCSLRGRQGICPGNRLRLLAGVYDKGGGPPSPPSTPTPSCAPSPGPPPSAGYPNHARRRSWKFQPTKVQLPHRVGDVYLYEQPQSLCSVSPSACPSHIQGQESLDIYDVPRPPVPINYDTPRNWSRGSPINKDVSQDWYDVPRNPVNVLLQQQQMTPSSSASSLTIDSMSSSNRSSLVNMPDYDVPKTRTPAQFHSMQQNQLYDTPTSREIHHHKELPMEWGKALDMLERLQSEATGAISKLLGFVRPGWRSHTALSPEILDVRLAALRLRAALHDLAEFAEGTLGNAANAHDKSLVIKLRPLVKALHDADILVNEVTTNLDSINWSADQLCRPEDADGVISLNVTPDSLDQLIACARTLTEDVRQTTSFIQGNSTLLFKKNKMNSNKGEWIEEYDYVKLESRTTINKKHSEIREDMPVELKKSFDKGKVEKMRRFNLTKTIESIKKTIDDSGLSINTSEDEITLIPSPGPSSSSKYTTLERQAKDLKQNISNVSKYGKRKRKRSVRTKLNLTRSDVNDCKKYENRSFNFNNDVSNDSSVKSENQCILNSSPILQSRPNSIFDFNLLKSDVGKNDEHSAPTNCTDCKNDSRVDFLNSENDSNTSPILKSNYVPSRKKINSKLCAGKSSNSAKKSIFSLERFISEEICIGSTESQSLKSNMNSQGSHISSLQVTPEKNDTISTELFENTKILDKEIIFMNNCNNVDDLEPAVKKKKKYPPNSDASRLHRLLRKQESIISIWKHEKYMASRGDFECPIIPEKSLTLKIRSCKEEYGLFLIYCEDCAENVKYIAIINSYFVKELTVCNNWILTIYKPYTIFKVENDNIPDVNNVIFNVCKFDVFKT